MQRHSNNNNAPLENRRNPRRKAARDAAHHPKRWVRWLTQIQEDFALSRGAFEEAVLHQIEYLDVSKPDRVGKWEIAEVWPRRSASRRSWQAYWIGEAVRALQHHRGVDFRLQTSGAESLSFGGYFGDLIAIMGLIVQGESSPNYGRDLVQTACRFAQPGVAKTVIETGVHGPTIVVGDYDRMLDEDIHCFWIRNTRPFNDAYFKWIREKRNISMGRFFDTARFLVQAGYETGALEHFWDAFAVESYRLSEIVAAKDPFPEFILKGTLFESKASEWQRVTNNEDESSTSPLQDRMLRSEDEIQRRHLFMSDGDFKMFDC